MAFHRSLEVGKTYELEGGREYKCLAIEPGPDAILERVRDKYILHAHGTLIEPDGKIRWDYSSGGHWPNGGGK